MGESRWGYGSWPIISTQPGMFAAAGPICGGGNPAFADKIVKVPEWVFDGAKDRVVTVDGSRKMITDVKKASDSPIYTELSEILFFNISHAIA